MNSPPTVPSFQMSNALLKIMIMDGQHKLLQIKQCKIFILANIPLLTILHSHAASSAPASSVNNYCSL
jgi:hypothetical protein